MGEVVRHTYIISDLHLGGVYPEPGKAPQKPGAADRGFRICTHSADLARFIDALAAKPVDNPAIELVVNGDLVDFLAERDPETGEFTPFNFKQTTALKKLEAIVSRDQNVFDALGRFLARGHRLVILLGNHDLELTMPAVRAALARLVGAKRGSDYEFVPGGEAYLVGDALIEHGNRYDDWNKVDHAGLARLAESLSRARRADPDHFDAPPGSHMVAHVINPIKDQYRFVDLLKPETGAVVPLILTLEPGFRKVVGRVALFASRARGALRVMGGVSSADGMSGPPGSDISSGGGMGGGPNDGGFGSDISSGGFESPNMGVAGAGGASGGPAQDENAALDALLNEELGADASELRVVLNESGGSEQIGSDISTVGEIVDRTFGLARLLVSRSGSDYRKRLDALLAAFRSLQSDQTFDETVETGPEYLNAATGLATEGIKHVVFGHTHMAKRIPLPSGGFYLNSGTWADVMEFPREVVTGPKDTAIARLGGFVQDLIDGNFASYALFRPTYVRLDLAADGSVTPALCRYADPSEV
jgi:UDP-2,3-diacylglucosamine pyrophosphatase LpxH